MENRYCLECGDRLYGRTDKKYCSDQCRNTFNNRLNKENGMVIRNTNRILKKNWKILQSIDPLKHSEVSREELLRLGLNFQYITAVDKRSNGEKTYYCYDTGYSKANGNQFKIVRKLEVE